MSFDMKRARVENPVRQEMGNRGREEDSSADFEEQETAQKTSPDSISWRAPEYEVYEKSPAWYLVAGLFILGIVVYAMFVNSPIMAITFILIGVVGYLYLQKDPRTLDFVINQDGVRVGNEVYEFDNIESFWIFYDPPHTKTLSLHTKASFMPFVHIPLADEDPVAVREVLTRFVSEEKQEAGLIDALERFLHI